jgi:hypothetical protein
MTTVLQLQTLVKMFVDETPLNTDELQILVNADCIKVVPSYGYDEMSLTEYGKYVLNSKARMARYHKANTDLN